MTLSELKLIRDVIEGNTVTYKAINEALLIVQREIKLKEMDPRK